MIVGMVITYKEGTLAIAAVRSLLACCDVVRVFDGPIGGDVGAGDQTDWKVFAKDQRVIVTGGAYDTEAEKRSAMVAMTRRYPAPTWGVTLDGDETLLWGEYLRDQIAHIESRERSTGQLQTGCSLRIVESDGSVGQINSRVLRLDLLDRYVHSSYHLRWLNGAETARPNWPLRMAGEPDMPPHKQVIDEKIADANPDSIPLIQLLQDELDRGFIQRRRPLQGEPHILHRSILRTTDRATMKRMHVVESEEMDTAVSVPVETGEGVRVWTP